MEYKIEAEAAKKGIPVAAVNRAAVKARWEAAGRAPDTAGDEATRAQVATAERWRADQLNALEDRRRRSRGVDAFGVPIPPMSDGEYQAAKARIEDAYRQSLGIPAPGPSMAAPLPGPPTAVVPRPIPAPGPAPIAAPPPAPAAPVAARKNVAIGSEVMYQGQRYRVKAIDADGQLELEPAQ